MPAPLRISFCFAAAACSLCDEFITVINPGWPDVIHAQTYVILLKSVCLGGAWLAPLGLPANLHYDIGA